MRKNNEVQYFVNTFLAMESMKLFNVNIKVKHKKSKFRMKEHLVGKTNIIDSSFSKETNMATMPA